MKKIKTFLVIVLLLFMTGCTAEYYIDINDNLITERLDVYVTNNNETEKDFLEYNLKKELFNFQYNNDEYYYMMSKIGTNDNPGVEISFNYEDYPAYAISAILNNCFDKSNVSYDDDKVYIKASGFICTEYNYLPVDDVVIKMTTELEMIEHNADAVIEDTYIWNISKNPKDINIVLKKKKQSEVEDFKQDKENIIGKKNKKITKKVKNTSWQLVLILLASFVIGILVIAIINAKRTQKR